MELDSINGENNRLQRVRGPLSISEAETKENSPSVDSGLSTIEKSKAVRPDLTPLMSIPVLSAPSNMQIVAFAIASVDTSGKPMTEIVRSVVLKGEEIKNNVLAGWSQNLREIEEYVRQLLSSPVYQQLLEIRQRGDPQSATVSGIQGVASAHAAAQSEPVSLLSTLGHWQETIEKVPPTANVPDPSAPKDSSQVLVLPLTAALLAGGLVVGTEIVNASTHPLGGIFEIVERLQPLFPTVSVQDLVLLINLMVIAPIYFNSWNEAVSNIKNRERHSYVQTAQNFAKDVIKIVADPNFVREMLMRSMRGIDQLSQADQDRLARMLKVVLIGVALSLLYSVEVGKVQDGKFGGIEPEELRDLLLGKWHDDLDSSKKNTEHEQLTLSLIKRANEQLTQLSIEDRTVAANMLLDYVTQTRELDPMLDPAKVFDETLKPITTLDPNGKIHIVKG